VPARQNGRFWMPATSLMVVGRCLQIGEIVRVYEAILATDGDERASCTVVGWAAVRKACPGVMPAPAGATRLAGSG
jgi:hypothetical protein